LQPEARSDDVNKIRLVGIKPDILRLKEGIMSRVGGPWYESISSYTAGMILQSCGSLLSEDDKSQESVRGVIEAGGGRVDLPADWSLFLVTYKNKDPTGILRRVNTTSWPADESAIFDDARKEAHKMEAPRSAELKLLLRDSHIAVAPVSKGKWPLLIKGFGYVDPLPKSKRSTGSEGPHPFVLISERFTPVTAALPTAMGSLRGQFMAPVCDCPWSPILLRTRNRTLVAEAAERARLTPKRAAKDGGCWASSTLGYFRLWDRTDVYTGKKPITPSEKDLRREFLVREAVDDRYKLIKAKDQLNTCLMSVADEEALLRVASYDSEGERVSMGGNGSAYHLWLWARILLIPIVVHFENSEHYLWVWEDNEPTGRMVDKSTLRHLSSQKVPIQVLHNGQTGVAGHFDAMVPLGRVEVPDTLRQILLKGGEDLLQTSQLTASEAGEAAVVTAGPPLPRPSESARATLEGKGSGKRVQGDEARLGPERGGLEVVVSARGGTIAQDGGAEPDALDTSQCPRPSGTVSTREDTRPPSRVTPEPGTTGRIAESFGAAAGRLVDADRSVGQTDRNSDEGPEPGRISRQVGATKDNEICSWGPHLLVIDWLGEEERGHSSDRLVEAVEKWAPASPTHWVKLVVLPGPVRTPPPGFGLEIDKWKNCRYVQNTWFHDEQVVSLLCRDLAMGRADYQLPTNEEEAGRVESLLVEKDAVLAEDWDGKPVHDHPVDSIVGISVTKRMTSYTVQWKRLMAPDKIVKEIQAAAFDPKCCWFATKPAATRPGWSLVTLPPAPLRVTHFRLMPGEMLIRLSGELIKRVEISEAEKVKGRKAPPTGKNHLAKRTRGKEPQNPVWTEWTSREGRWDFRAALDVYDKTPKLERSVALACFNAKCLDDRSHSLDDPRHPRSEPPDEACAAPTTEDGTEPRSRDGPPEPRLDPLPGRLCCSPGSDMSVVHLLTLIARFSEFHSRVRDNADSRSNRTVVSCDAILGRVQDGAWLNLSSWIAEEKADLQRTIGFLRESPRMTALISEPLPLPSVGHPGGPISFEDIPRDAKASPGALVFVFCETEKTTVPQEVWSWRRADDQVLVAVLDDGGRGTGLYRTDLGPCLFSPGRISPQLGKEDESKVWSSPVLVFAGGYKTVAGSSESASGTRRSCRKCGSLTPDTGACTRKPAAHDPLCADCAKTSGRCGLCKKRVASSHTQCKGCKERFHTKCAKLAWTHQTRCTHPACSTPRMPDDLPRKPQCTECSRDTLLDRGAKQCQGCKRDFCSSCVTDGPCGRCSVECEHKSLACRRCPRWWEVDANTKKCDRNKLVTARNDEP
jgi:hypothetical protein